MQFERNWDALKKNGNKPQRNEVPKERLSWPWKVKSCQKMQFEKGAHGP